MKLKQKNSASTTLSDKIAGALTVKPRADIEDDHVFGTKPKTVSRADLVSSESEDEATISEFRKRNVNLLSNLSKKYEGEVVSRKQLENLSGGSDDSDSDVDENQVQNGHKSNLKISDDEASSSNEIQKKLRAAISAKSDSENFDSDEGESDDYSISKNSLVPAGDEDEESEDDDGDENNDGDENDEGSEDDDEGEGYDISLMEEPPKEEFEHMKKQNISEEAKKGACVRNQLLVWESLLEMRIHLQRCMTTANQMPMPNTFKELAVNDEFIEKCNTSKANITNVLDKFLLLQNMLFKNFPETKGLSSNKNQDKQKNEITQKASTESDEEIPSDTDNEEIPSDTEPEDNGEPTKQMKKKETQPIQQKKRKLEDYEKDISTSHKAFKLFRDSTIQKWNEKTRLAMAANIKNAPTNTILQQISYILSDKDKLTRRTQLKRSEYEIVGYKKEPSLSVNTEENGVEKNPTTKDRKDDDEYIPEIFDDSDFYHQLLRELIECKSADITDPVQLSRQWIALQQMRSKMKRKVDTKATKGRKIKYVVHNKLVNFMGSEKCNTWLDDTTNELFSSLFGKMFEQNNVGVNVTLDGFKLKN